MATQSWYVDEGCPILHTHYIIILRKACEQYYVQLITYIHIVIYIYITTLIK